MTITAELVEKPKSIRPHVRRRIGLQDVTIKRETARDSDGWEHFAYLVRLTNTETGATMNVPYRAGIANTDEPTASDVLYCVLSDASGYESARDVGDYANEYGITDVRRALELWAQVEKQSKDARALLGALYHDAIYPPDDHEAAAARLTQ